MPRELITGNPGDERMVKVGWAKDRDVQLGVMFTVGSDLDDRAQWIDLSRQQINDLIRLLRKARDSAYGRDE